MTEMFQSSDSVRSSRPLRYIRSFQFSDPLDLELGGQIRDITVAYETYGRLNADRDNTILICHALSGDSHVARHNEADDPGWWDIAVGPGKAMTRIAISSYALIPWVDAAEPPGRTASIPKRGGAMAPTSPRSLPWTLWKHSEGLFNILECVAFLR